MDVGTKDQETTNFLKKYRPEMGAFLAFRGVFVLQRVENFESFCMADPELCKAHAMGRCMLHVTLINPL